MVEYLRVFDHVGFVFVGDKEFTMFRKTGPDGQVDEQPGGNQARLSDFDIEGAALKPKHVAFLNKIIQQIKATPNREVVIFVGGTADTLGKGKFDNKGLSERRASAVADHIRKNLPAGAKVKFDTQGFGDDPASAKDAANVRDDFFRAVDVALTDPNAPRPRRPRQPNVNPRKETPIPKPERPASCLIDDACPAADSFTVQLIAGFSVGEGGEIGAFDFLIRDTTHSLTAAYRLRSGGVGLGSPVNASIQGKPSPFRTSTAVRVTRFGPVASFSSGTVPLGPTSVLSVSFGVLNLSFRPDGATIPSLKPFIPVDTGDLTIPGVGVEGGLLSLQTVCGNRPGASRS